MSRLQKKCLLGSTLFHGFLLLLLVSGSAFFAAKDRPLTATRINVVPSRLVEAALAGGGGNPALPRTDDQQKGETLQPQPDPPPAPAPAQPATPTRTAPPPRPEPTRTQPTRTPSTKPFPKPAEKPKNIAKAPAKDNTLAPLDLKPINRTAADKQKAQAQAEAAERARRLAGLKRDLLRQWDKNKQSLQSGFASGTKVEVGGTGGEAYAGYAIWLQAVYDEAWVLTDTFNADSPVALVQVRIARDGRVLDARITRRSGHSGFDRSVQRALDKVKFIEPFPPSMREAEKTFTIEFNEKAKRGIG
jgi:colicin import membrane protein